MGWVRVTGFSRCVVELEQLLPKSLLLFYSHPFLVLWPREQAFVGAFKKSACVEISGCWLLQV